MDENTKTVLMAALAFAAPILSAIVYYLMHVRVESVVPPSATGIIPPAPTPVYVDLTLEDASTKVLLSPTKPIP